MNRNQVTHGSLRRRDWAALIFAMVFPTLTAWLYFDLLAGSPWVLGIYLSGKIVQVVLPVFWVLLVQRRALRPRWPGRSGLAAGALFGMAVIGFLLISYYLFFRGSEYLGGMESAIRQKLDDFGIHSAVEFLGLALFISVLNSAMEEYYFRWFIFGQLQRGTSFPLAALISSIAFAAHHVVVVNKFIAPQYFWTATLFFAGCVGLGGLAWAWIYRRSNSFYAVWLSHFMVDLGVMFVGYDQLRGQF